MKTVIWIGGLCAALLAGQAAAADRVCKGSVSDWPGEMSVSLTVDEAGRLKSAFARLRLGGKEMQFPFATVEYELPNPREARLGEIPYLSVVAMVSKDQAPTSKTAEIVLSIDDKATWGQPWGLYAERGWEGPDKGGDEPVGFFGILPFEARQSGIGKALETAQFLGIAVRGVEARENFGRRQHALARREVLQPMADQAHAAALVKLPAYRTACEAVRD